MSVFSMQCFFLNSCYIFFIVLTFTVPVIFDYFILFYNVQLFNMIKNDFINYFCPEKSHHVSSAIALCINQLIMCYIFYVWLEHTEEIWLGILTFSTDYVEGFKVIYVCSCHCGYCHLWVFIGHSVGKWKLRHPLKKKNGARLKPRLASLPPKLENLLVAFECCLKVNNS